MGMAEIPRIGRRKEVAWSGMRLSLSLSLTQEPKTSRAAIESGLEHQLAPEHQSLERTKKNLHDRWSTGRFKRKQAVVVAVELDTIGSSLPTPSVQMKSVPDSPAG